MDEAMRASVIKQCRRAILDALNAAYPTALGFRTLLEAVSFLQVDAEQIERDLAYLVDKRLVSEREVNGRRWSRMYRLTPEGKEQADHIRRDPALEP